MRVYQREAERLSRARKLVREKYPRFGVNKEREIVRLIYEISKRDGIDPGEVVSPEPPAAFGELKAYLLKRRFPSLDHERVPDRFYLPALELEEEDCRQERPVPFAPRRIFVEKAVSQSRLAAVFKESFPSAAYAEIPSLRAFMGEYPGGRIVDYNRRSETVFVIDEERDFFKRCPCTRQAVPCGYHIFNLSFGCIYECAYCYLQEYVNTPGLLFPADIDRFLERLSDYLIHPATRLWQRGRRLRLGTGEFSDSLMLDNLTGYSLPLVEFFRGRDDVVFELKTKSANIENLLKKDPRGNIVVAWSLNPREIISQNELYTAALDARLSAASLVSEAGYRTAFHFDPVFFFPGWEESYRDVIGELFETIDPGRVAWISLGTFRFKPRLKKIIEARFPGNKILDAEMVLGYDGKLRYPPRVRSRIYRFLIDELLKENRSLPIYLCMENKAMWKELQLNFPF